MKWHRHIPFSRTEESRSTKTFNSHYLNTFEPTWWWIWHWFAAIDLLFINGGCGYRHCIHLVLVGQQQPQLLCLSGYDIDFKIRKQLIEDQITRCFRHLWHLMGQWLCQRSDICRPLTQLIYMQWPGLFHQWLQSIIIVEFQAKLNIQNVNPILTWWSKLMCLVADGS